MSARKPALSRIAGDRLSKNIGNEIGGNNLIAGPRRNPVNDGILEARPV
jgi:hypothetical protein